MKMFLEKCRKCDAKKSFRTEMRNTVLILLFGISLGLFSKWLDTISINNDVLWLNIIEKIDLRNVFSRLSIWALFALIISIYSSRATRASINVFSFFIGMLFGYYFYTIYFAGFYPKSYMISWGIITLFTPLLAIFTWYAKGKGPFAIFVSSIIIGFFFSEAFSFGLWYFDIYNISEFLFFIVSIVLLYRGRKQLIYTLICAIIMAPFINELLPYIFGGL